MNIQLLVMEACAVGIITIIIGYFIIVVMDALHLKLNKNVQMVIGFFMLGVLIHLICEFTGVNKFYCKKGHACRYR